MKHTQQKGSEIAKAGFQNEEGIIQKFNNWKFDKITQQWLVIMGYELKNIENVQAVKIPIGYKSDVQVQVSIFLKNIIEAQNIQVKLVSTKNGFNQIDRRWISKCEEQRNMPSEIAKILRYFTGELLPYLKNSKSRKRMFMGEFPQAKQNLVINWITNNKTIIISDILKGRGKFASEWMLVAQTIQTEQRWILKPMNHCLNFFGNGEVIITKKGSINIGKIGIQRKGGDGGRLSANQLQFKINPTLLFENN